MSIADYSQKLEDHQRALVVVRSVGPKLSTKYFNRLFDRLSRLNNVAIPGQQRTLQIRYKRSYPVENNEWGDFQAHRKVIGLICIGHCESENELGDVHIGYEAIKQQYANTLFDTRLVVFGLNKDGTSIVPETETKNGQEDSDSGNRTSSNKLSHELSKEDRANSNISDKKSEDGGGSPSEVDGGSDSKLSKSLKSPIIDTKTPSQRSKTPIRDPLNANSLLENANRLQQQQDKIETEQQPGQKEKDVGGSSTHTFFYPSFEDSSDLEEKIRDYAGSLFWVLESKRMDRSLERQDRLMLLMTPFEKKDFVGIDTDSRTYKKRCLGRLRKHLADLCLLSGLPAEALLHYQTALDTLRSANDWLWLAGAYEGLCAASVAIMYPQVLDRSDFRRNISFSVKRGVSAINEAKLKQPGTVGRNTNGLDLADGRSRSCLLPEDIIDKYKEAIMHYSKKRRVLAMYREAVMCYGQYKNAGIIEMEASIKACKVLIMQHKCLEASEFLQNVVYINLQLSEDEKIQRYGTLSSLYSQLGMKRKSAFFQRVAAMQCVAPQNPKPAWLQCYHLLLQALEGYKLSLDPRDIPPNQMWGWPIVQLRVLHELIYSARRMGNPAIAVRHLTLLLHTMFEHLTPTERREMTSVLESYTVKCEGSATSLALDDGTILPPVPLLKFPLVRSFKLHTMPPHLRPTELHHKELHHKRLKDSPFIYSPIQPVTASDNEIKDPAKMDFKWVDGDICEVALQVYNPMPFELKVSNMSLLTEGVEFEAYPASLSLPAESGPYPVKILGTPKEAGQLTVLGYTTSVLGVRSHCRLRDVWHIKEDKYIIDVVPSLPQMSVTTSLPKAASFSSMADSASVVTSGTVMLYAGQSCECEVMISNTGKQPIEKIELHLDSRIQPDLLRRVFVWDEATLHSQLPIQPNTTASFTIHVHGASDFLPLNQSDDEEDDQLPFSPRTKATRWFSTEVGDSAAEDGQEAVIVEALLKLQYSGGPGLTSGYCRQSSVALTVEIQPSLVFTRWDVLPAQSCHNCHLVLDIENTTSHEMEVLYGVDQSMIIEVKQIKRVGLQIARCTLPAPPKEDPNLLRGTYMQRESRNAILDEYSQIIADLVDIRWRLGAVDTEGKATMERLRWTDPQLDQIRIAPLLWEIKVNGQVLQSCDAVKCDVGGTISVLCTVKNNIDAVLEDVLVRSMMYQDLDNGAQRRRTLDEVVSLGPNRTIKTKLEPGESADHASCFMFLCPGRFKLDVTCSGLPPEGTQQSTDPNDKSTVQIWRIAPAVTVQVREPCAS